MLQIYIRMECLPTLTMSRASHKRTRTQWATNKYTFFLILFTNKNSFQVF